MRGEMRPSQLTQTEQGGLVSPRLGVQVPPFLPTLAHQPPGAPVAVSLFCGAGGLSLGFRTAGFRVALACDIDRAATETYAAMLPGTQVLREDVRNLTARDIRDSVGGRVDIVIGGPPCQGFSSAGAKWWDDPRNALLRAYVHLLGELRPAWFLMENVEGLLTAHESRYMAEFIERVLDLGYWVRLDKLNVAHYGVPQRRKRVLVVGNLSGERYEPPQPTHGDDTGDLDLLPGLALWEAISDLPEATTKDEEAYFTSRPNNDLQALLRGAAEKVVHHFSSELPERALVRIRALGQGQDMRHLPPALQHESYRRRAFRRVMDGTPTERRGGAPAGLQRLIPGRPSKTITSAAVTEFIHPYRHRPLTVRECARIQTFPDWYEFSGTPTQKITQIGNAVPPLVAVRLAAHIRQFMVRRAVRASKKGRLLGFCLSRSLGLSPALTRTEDLLIALQGNRIGGESG